MAFGATKLSLDPNSISYCQENTGPGPFLTQSLFTHLQNGNDGGKQFAKVSVNKAIHVKRLTQSQAHGKGENNCLVGLPWCLNDSLSKVPGIKAQHILNTQEMKSTITID